MTGSPVQSGSVRVGAIADLHFGRHAAAALAPLFTALSEAVDELVGDRFGIVEEYVGHGIGTAMHQPPDVPNYRSRDRGARVQPGLAIAVEPMLTRGGAATHELADGWTVRTDDGSRAAHWEHTVAVLPDGRLWVLTARDGGVAGLAAWPGVAASPDEV